MKIVGYEQPSLEEALEHHGVIGMHWGVRKAHPTSTEIHNARYRQAQRIEGLRALDRQVTTASSSRERAAATKKAQKLARDWQTNEDRVTAARITAGEKFIQILLLGPFATISLASASARAKATIKKTDAARAQLAAEKK